MKLIDAIKQVELLAKEVQSQGNSREIALVITKLQEARLWEQERLDNQAG